MNFFASITAKSVLLATCLAAMAAPVAGQSGASPRPLLLVEDRNAVLHAPPGAVYGLLAGLRQAAQGHAADTILPVLVLGCGQVAADGIVRVALSASDFAQLQAADAMLQAVVLADGEPLQMSGIASLRPPDKDGDVPDNATGGDALATIGAPRFGRSSGVVDTLGAPRFGRNSGVVDTIGAPRFSRNSGVVGTIGAPRFSR